MAELQQYSVVLFDGVCNYCNTMVNFAIKHNKARSLRFAALQSEAGIALKSQYNIDDNIDSLVLIEEGRAYVYSSAAFKICKHLNFPYSLAYGLMVLPKFIRDAGYKWFAKNRYKWFGKKDSCMIPTAEVRSLF